MAANNIHMCSGPTYTLAHNGSCGDRAMAMAYWNVWLTSVFGQVVSYYMLYSATKSRDQISCATRDLKTLLTSISCNKNFHTMFTNFITHSRQPMATPTHPQSTKLHPETPHFSRAKGFRFRGLPGKHWYLCSFSKKGFQVSIGTCAASPRRASR